MTAWWIHLLVFVFGYVTCRAFYFMRTARTSLTLLRCAHVIYLSAMVKAIENLSYSREMVLEHMARTEKNAHQIGLFQYRYEEDVRMLKERSIEALIALHPEMFRDTVEFDDWAGGMRYLMEFRAPALQFWDKK